jgi:protein-S-isoprenylcysteine O-methyltransferase Ste14
LTPLAFTVPEAFPFWAVLVWAFVPECRLTARSAGLRLASTPADAGSLPLIVFGLAAANIAALPMAFVEATQFRPFLQRGLFVIGLGVLVAGSLLRRHCWRMLGQHFTSAVVAEVDRPINERGAYGWVRHPAYAASLLMHLGYGLALGSWGSTLLVIGMGVLVYSYRIGIEERLLLATLGAPYQAYMQRHKRLIPFVY